MKMATRVIHKGNRPDEQTGAIIAPIHQTSTYVQNAPGEHKGYEYTRSHNPTRTRLEECLASLEDAKHALVSASGMSAVDLILHTLPPGSHVLCGDDVYGGTHRLFSTVYDKIHHFRFIDTTSLENVQKAIEEHTPALLWLESPSNPLLKITDLKQTCQLAKKTDTLTVVDNTFMSPWFQNPLKLGADLVVHSMTKYLNGHSDVVGGAIMTSHQKLHEQLWVLQNSIGPSQSPFDSWLVLRGLKTLGVRMEAHQKNALALASWLEQHPRIQRVLYPGLPSHPQHSIARAQMSGFGGMMTIFLKGGLAESKGFLSKVKLFALAESLGGVESLIEHPAMMTHASVPLEVREQLGISDNLIRLSVGIEDVEDLKADLDKALDD